MKNGEQKLLIERLQRLIKLINMKKLTKYFILLVIISGSLMPLFFVRAEEESWTKIYPECIQQQMNAKPGDTFDPKCDDVGVFVELAINVGAYMFSFIGALALLVFVYGGFKMIISAGDSAKIKEGKDAMIAAVIGIVIAFSGVAIVRFLSDTLQVKDIYRIDKDLEVICCRLPDGKTVKDTLPNCQEKLNGFRVIMRRCENND